MKSYFVLRQACATPASLCIAPHPIPGRFVLEAAASALFCSPPSRSVPVGGRSASLPRPVMLGAGTAELAPGARVGWRSGAGVGRGGAVAVGAAGEGPGEAGRPVTPAACRRKGQGFHVV